MIQMKPIYVAVCLIVLMVFTYKIATSGESETSQLTWLLKADPIQDARMAFNDGDYRLRAIYGYALIVPGITESKVSDYENLYGLNPIVGTSDSLFNEENGKLNKLAFEYARKYTKECITHPTFRL